RLVRKPFELLIILVIVFFAFRQFTIPASWGWPPANEFGGRMLLWRSFYTALTVAIGWLGIRIIKFGALFFKKQAAQTPTPLDDQLVPFVKDTLIVLWSMACFLFMLSKVFEVNVWALITSLGVGGIIVALAARETFENLIGSVVLMLERPFTVGDAIVLGTLTGDIVEIGFRSTRVRTHDGSYLTVPNRLLTSQSLENITKRTHRRARFYVRLAYSTPLDTLQQIISQIKHLLDQHPLTQDKEGLVRLEVLNESSLDILVVFHAATSDWRLFMDTREEINLRIIEIVRTSGANFAFPSRHLFIKESDDQAA
ncbi:MAG: mechanosensitive ion channel family protein, partial [Runella sp.]